MTGEEHARRAGQASPLQTKKKPCERRSLQNLVRRAGRRFDAEGDLVSDADAVTFEGHDFFRVIGEDANVFEAEVDQDLRADAAFVLDQALARGFAVELAALVKMNLRKRAWLFGG